MTKTNHRIFKIAIAALAMNSACARIVSIPPEKQLVILNQKSLPSGIISDAKLAYYRIYTCGVEIPNKIEIFLTPMEDKTGKTVICGKAFLNTDFIMLNQDLHLFDQNEICGPGFMYTIGHEMLHLAGYSHATPSESVEFKNMLKKCGFGRD